MANILEIDKEIYNALIDRLCEKASIHSSGRHSCLPVGRQAKAGIHNSLNL